MEIPNEVAFSIIRHFEGWRPRVYRCPAGLATIGYGSTYGLDGERVTMAHREITLVEGDQLLCWSVGSSRRSVARLVKVPLTINQRSALISLCYNIGSGNFQGSTLRAMVNRYEDESAANEFWKWRRAGGVILAGLVRRREAERALFVAPPGAKGR